MTITDLYPPIAAATVINAFLFAGFWRGGQIEKATGKDPWWLGLGLAGYAGALGLFMYLQGKQPLAGWFDYFATAMVGEAMGALVVFCILNAFVFMQGEPRGDRVLAFGFAALLTGLIVASMVAG